jgi:hypothetical protein
MSSSWVRVQQPEPFLRPLNVVVAVSSLDPSDLSKTPSGASHLLVHRTSAAGTIPCPASGCGFQDSVRVRGLKRHMKKKHAFTWKNDELAVPAATAASVYTFGPVSKYTSSFLLLPA